MLTLYQNEHLSMNKETIKNFIKLGVVKIVLTFIFLVIPLAVFSSHGFPSPYFFFLENGPIGGQGIPLFFDLNGLLVDILFWYIVSSTIVFIFSKFRKR